MKILYTNFHTHYKGGHATYILNLWQALHLHHEIYIADPRTSGLHEEAKRLLPQYLHAQNYPKKILQLPKIFTAALALRRFIQAKKIALIHTNGSPDLQLVLLACLGLKNKPKIVYTKHNSLPIHKNFFSKLKFNSAAAIIVVCGCQKAGFIQAGIPAKNVHVIKNGIDTQYFAPASPALKQKMRAQLGFLVDDLVLVSSAGPSLYKRWDCMVAAVSQLPQKNIKIVIIGGLPPETDKQRFVDTIGMRAQVIFTGMQADTRPYVAAGDLGFVLSDQVETVSFACREMMSMGLPMIVSDYACLPENVTPNENGWVIPAGDITALKNVLEKLLTQRDILPLMGQRAREQALREFGIQHFAQATENIYRSLFHS
jgi:glycosyltransferase involved in cell wall biosynthesis